jgi:hypothetical protein
MPVKVNADQLTEKWQRRLKGAIEDMRAGVQRVTVAPGASAAEKADKWQAAISEARTKDKWRRRVGAVTLEEWKKSMTEKGLSRIASGVDGAGPKMKRFAAQLIEHQNAGLAALEKMPDLTLEDSINRMAAWTRHMARLVIE